MLERAMNARVVTMAWLDRQTPGQAFDRLVEVVRHNIDVIRLQIEDAAGRPPLERLLRIYSGVLPGYTHPVAKPYYEDADLRTLIEDGLGEAGRIARERGVRLSMHPGQHAILATVGGSLDNAVSDIEYHVEVMRLLGHAGGWHPHGAHVNVHGGRREMGAEGVLAGLARLSEDARGLITVENDEVSFGLDDLLPMAHAAPIVWDIHHHWIKTKGEYLTPDDPRLDVVRRSWRGVRPVAHVSAPREDLVPSDPDILPDFAALAANGANIRDLRAHSDRMWNRALNDLILRHLAWADFEVEAKHKNLASEGLAAHVTKRRLALQ